MHHIADSSWELCWTLLAADSQFNTQL